MRKETFIRVLAATALATAIAVSNPANAQQYYGGGMTGGYGMMGPGMMGQGYMPCPGCGYGMMGPGMMGGYGPGMMGPGMMGGYGSGMMGPGMMGPGMMGGYGSGMMGWGYGQQQGNLSLSAGDVKTYLDRYIAVMGNPHVKAGAVTEKDANTITAEIVTTDKEALVQRFAVDRRTGFWQPVQ